MQAREAPVNTSSAQPIWSSSAGVFRASSAALTHRLPSIPHLHVTVELDGQALVFHFYGLHAGELHPGVTEPIVKVDLHILLFAVKQDIGTAACQLEILAINREFPSMEQPRKNASILSGITKYFSSNNNNNS